MKPRHLLSIKDSEIDFLQDILERADFFNKKEKEATPLLKGKTTASLFFEDSTRTRLSFETAAKRLSAETMNLSVSASSLSKGESLRDTVETVASLGADCLIVRHSSSGFPWQMADWLNIPVINAGDGFNAHPTQALLDYYTAQKHLGSLKGRKVLIVGDSGHSRVARSVMNIFQAFGSEVVLCGPKTLLPFSNGYGEIQTTPNFENSLSEVDILYMLRIQKERIAENLFPSLREYTHRFGLTAEKAKKLPKHAIIMHPGPVNKGVEISQDAAAMPNVIISEQVEYGIPVRMAVLASLLGENGNRTKKAEDKPNE